MLLDQHSLNLEIIIDDVHFEMVDKHHTYPEKKKQRKIGLKRKRNFHTGCEKSC